MAYPHWAPTGMYWPLTTGRTQIGRDERCEVRLGCAGVEHVHAVINARQQRDQRYPVLWLTDQQTDQGTRLNGEELLNNRPFLKDRDVIGVGPVDLLLLLVAGRA